MDNQLHDHPQDTYHLHDISGGSGMAGWIFESITDRVLSGKDAPQYTAMVSNGENPPTFSTIDIPPLPAPSGKTSSVVEAVDILQGLSSVTPSGRATSEVTSTRAPRQSRDRARGRKYVGVQYIILQ